MLFTRGKARFYLLSSFVVANQLMQGLVAMPKVEKKAKKFSRPNITVRARGQKRKKAFV